jgi:hypothetical protein
MIGLLAAPSPLVECAADVPIDELAAPLPHGRIGVTAVEAIRAAGGDVIRTSGRSPNHATLVGLTPEEASCLLTPTVANPAKKRGAMMPPRVYADFQNADPSGRIRLNCTGTLADLARERIELREGLPLTLYADDFDNNGQPDELITHGVASYSHDEHCWVATVDWGAIRHRSDERPISPAAGEQLEREASQF